MNWIMLSLILASFASTIAVPAHAQDPMTFYMKTDPEDRFVDSVVYGYDRIYAAGEIVDGSTDDFRNFISRHNVSKAKVYFDSPGGSLIEGMKLGKLIRSMGMSTSVGVYSISYTSDADKKSMCASACVYAFAGGVNRFIDATTGALGVHQFYSGTEQEISSESVQHISGLIVAYLDEMGVDAKAFTLSTMANKDGIIWLDPEEATKLRLANNGEEIPTAEIRLSGMTPYLRIEQRRHNSTTRVIISCVDKTILISFGIVTDPETSAMIVSNQVSSYIEFDLDRVLHQQGKNGSEVSGSVVWIRRWLTHQATRLMLNSASLSGWIDGSGAFRYGGSIDIPPIRANMKDFSEECYGS